MGVVAEHGLKLNLGCGPTRIAGYVNVDNEHAAADLNANMGHLPYGDGSVDHIYCAHALEHLGFAEATSALSEWHRVLRSGGRLTVIVPNMDFVCGAWLHGSDRNYARQIMFGNQAHPGEFHRNGWARQDLRDDVAAAGFFVISCDVRFMSEWQQESLLLEAEKL